MYCTRKVTEDLIWVGGNDRRKDLFEGVYPIALGVAYNSYVLLDEKTVLMDTADKAIAGLFFENVIHALQGRKLDYFIVQHMEPDHAALIGEVLCRYPEAVLVCNAKTETYIRQFFGSCAEGRVQLVKEGDVLDTGRHKLTFVNAPMVHWPEVMVTYDITDKILFSADAFGTFGAQNGALFADEVDFEAEYGRAARRYYTNIVGKYGPQVQAVLKKAGTLDIAMICPLHGFVWRKNIGWILEKYSRWSSYTPEEAGVVLAYGTIYGHSENAAEILASELRQRGVTVKVYDCSETHKSVILADCFRYSHMVFVAPTYNGGIYTPVEELLRDLAAHNLQKRTVGLIENGTWTPVAARQIKGILESMKNITVLEPVITVRSAVSEEQLGEFATLADAVAASVKDTVL